MQKDLINQPMPLSILVVDDDLNIRKTLSYCLSSSGHDVIAVGNGVDALDEARAHYFHVAFIDLKLREENGIDLIPRILSDSPWIKIIVITGHASIQSAVEAMKNGAFDYLQKPFSPEEILFLTHRLGGMIRLENEVAFLNEKVQPFKPEAYFQSKNPSMQRIIEIAKKAAESEAIILLQGESGTGKSALAAAIHRWSSRASRPFITVSCPSIPSELLESELFGHVKGAFTGAQKDYPGRITSCEGGTLFLDEIGDLPLSMQTKLLRFIQEKQYERLGEGKTRYADVRILAATNMDLEKLVSEKRFREDLYYRLNVISITIPPLRERSEDILPIAYQFLVYFNHVNHKNFKSIEPDAEAALLQYSWPGNIRELRNMVERAVILGRSNTIILSDLFPNQSTTTTLPKIGDPIPLSVIEETHIRYVLKKIPSLKEAADVLGIDQTTLWRKRKMYGI